MAREKLTLTLNPGEASELQYEIDAIQSVDISSSKEAFSIAPPGLSASENILLGVSGMNADITINFRTWDNGSDRANGTYTSAVTTVPEQTTYLEEEIQAPDFSAAWELDHATGSAFNDDPVFVERVDVTPISLDSPKWKPATIRLRRGQSV